MNMKKSAVSTALATMLGGISYSASAALTSSNVLNFNAGGTTFSCQYGTTLPNPGPNGCSYAGTITSVTGSYFLMDTKKNGFQDDVEQLLIKVGQGIQLGVTTIATGAHGGAINGNESPAFDIWEFFGNTGMDYSINPIVEVGTHGTSTTATLDLSGWRVAWNTIPSINMGGGSQNCGTTNDGICVDNFGNDIGGTYDNGTGLATITCSLASCSVSSTFVLDYDAVVPQADPSNFGGVSYKLHLEGTVEAVPVPAAAWLFGTGLIGLVGVARRRTQKV